MITKRLSGLVLGASMLLLFSCGKKSPSYTRYIPKDASTVVGIDVKTVLEKLNKDSLSVENIMAAFKDESSTEKYTRALDMYNQFKDAGIDWSNRVYVTLSSSGMGMMGGGSFSSEMVAGMNDASKFEEFLKKQPQTKNIQKGDDFSYTINGESTIGWNKDAVIVVYTQAAPSYNDYLPDSLGGMSKPPSENNSTASVDLLKKYFKQEKSASIAEAEGFGELQSQKADLVVYSQTGDVSNSMPFLAMMPKLKDLLKGYSTSTLNFEDGKVVTESTAHLSKEMADLLKKYAGPEVDLDLIEHYPSTSIDGVMAFSFKPELIKGLIEYMNLGQSADGGLQQVGLTQDDLVKFFKGDFAVVVSDFGLNQEVAGKDAMTTSSLTPTAKVIFTAKLGDKATVDKVLKLAQDRGFIIRNGNSLAPSPSMSGGRFPFAVSIANDVLVFASDSTVFNAYLSKNQKIDLAADVKSTLKGKAVSGYIDAQKILAGFPATMFDSSEASQKAVLDKARATFKNGWYTIDNLSGSTITSKAELNFMDEKKNSLAQIVRFGLYAYEQTKAEREARMKEWESMPADGTLIDTAASPAAPIR